MSTLDPNKMDIVFVAAKRTPFGAFGGSLQKHTATDMGAHAAKACLDQIGASGEEIDSVIFGSVVQSAKDSIYLARHIGLRVGVPVAAPALTVNRLCGSGFEAIAQGAYALTMEGARAVLVGGSESMSQIPYVLRGARFGYRLGNSEMEDYLTASLTDAHVNLPMAMTAENLAEQYKISREEIDRYALLSQQRTATALAQGRFKKEIAPMKLKAKGGEVLLENDEHPRPDTKIESLAKLAPLFKKDGVVTAGNASGMVDGAAALIMTTKEHAQKKGWKVLGHLKAWASTGCDPKIMGIGPVPATHKALERLQQQKGERKALGDFKQIEVNEAFCAQYLAVEKELGLNREKTNIHGGATAIGHPLGATGARLVAHLLYSLGDQGGGWGLASACIGGGQGMSVIIEV